MERKSFYDVVLSFQRQTLCLLNHLMVHDSKDSNSRYRGCARELNRTHSLTQTQRHAYIIVSIHSAMPMFLLNASKSFFTRVSFFISFHCIVFCSLLLVFFCRCRCYYTSVYGNPFRLRLPNEKCAVLRGYLAREWVSESVNVVSARAVSRCVYVLRLLCVNVLNKRPYFPHTT